MSIRQRDKHFMKLWIFYQVVFQLHNVLTFAKESSIDLDSYLSASLSLSRTHVIFKPRVGNLVTKCKTLISSNVKSIRQNAAATHIYIYVMPARIVGGRLLLKHTDQTASSEAAGQCRIRQ